MPNRGQHSVGLVSPVLWRSVSPSDALGICRASVLFPPCQALDFLINSEPDFWCRRSRSEDEAQKVPHISHCQSHSCCFSAGVEGLKSPRCCPVSVISPAAFGEGQASLLVNRNLKVHVRPRHCHVHVSSSSFHKSEEIESA